MQKGAVTIKQTKNNVRWVLKIVKIGEIFMFYHLKPWQSWQVIHFSFTRILMNSNQKSI
jgi:L-asparagine transporter-like permease